MRVAILGYYGFGNLGDEAVLWAMRAHLQEALPGVEVWVLSADPAWTENVHGVHSLPRTNLRAVRRLFRSSHLVCSGGGSLFQDVTSWRSPLFYGLLHELARGRPILVYAQGLGPLRRRVSRAVTRKAMQSACRITLRDEDSALLLRQLGVQRPTEVVCDPALALPAAGGVREPMLAVCVRPWQDVPWSGLVEALRTAARASGLPVRVVCLHRRADLPMATRLAEELTAELAVPSTPQEAFGLLGRAQAVVGMRLHALVLAAAAGVPFVGIAYDPKVSSFANSLGMPWVPSHLPDPGKVARCVADLLREAGAGERLRRGVRALQTLARRPAQVAAEILGVRG